MSAQYESVQHAMNILEKLIGQDSELMRTFRQCLPNTLETTVREGEDGKIFVITGDIPAMWLRDSTAQIRPYLRFLKGDMDVQRVFKGVISQQVDFLLIDAYANAFNCGPTGHGHRDETLLNPWVWERKFELDSLCYPISLWHDYFTTTKDRSIFTEKLHQAMHTIVSVMRVEQHHNRDSGYRFERRNCPESDTLPFGTGTPVNFTGMVWSGFRPSDDACRFGYLIPSNMFAVVVLRYLADFSREMYADQWLADEAEKLRADIEFGIQTYGVVHHPKYGRMYAYETDGYGNYLLMDDANVPSLLSIPYLGYTRKDDGVYQSTRRFVLSEDNPYYFHGAVASGVGSPHTPDRYVWPIALSMQALTSDDELERANIFQILLRTTDGTGYMHESFDVDDASRYTRAWFAWANSLFAEMAMKTPRFESILEDNFAVRLID